MGCGSSRATANVTPLPLDHTEIVISNQNVDQDTAATNIENIERYANDGTMMSSGYMENFRRKKVNLVPTLEIFSDVDKRSYELPAACKLTIRSIAEYLTEPFDSELLKLRALWIWVTHNIEYDAHAYFNSGDLKNSKVDAVDIVSSRKAVCSGYANLFMELNVIVGIKMERVTGWSKGYSYVAGMKLSTTDPNHAWNVVFLDNSWWLLDPTWGAGYVDENKNFIRQYAEHYFLADPNQFIYDHLPENPDWQLLEYKVTGTLYEALLKLTKQFFQLNIKPLTHPNGVIECDTGKLHIKFRLDKEVPVKCTGKLLEDGQPDIEGSEKYIHIYATEKTLHVLVDVPNQGVFRLKLFARKALKDEEKNVSSLPLICTYQVRCTEKLGKASEYPKQFKQWNVGFRLHSPIEGVLYVGETYKFRISLPGVKDMAICLGGEISKWENIENTNKDTWDGELTLPHGTQRVNVVARFNKHNGNTPFTSVLEYKVVAKDMT